MSTLQLELMYAQLYHMALWEIVLAGDRHEEPEVMEVLWDEARRIRGEAFGPPYS
jgi:hypothetical protein